MMLQKVFSALFFTICVLFSVEGSNRSDIYQVFINKDTKGWKTVLDRMEKEPVKTNASLLELINYEYGYVGWCLNANNEKEGLIYMRLAEKQLDYLEKIGYKKSSVQAYKSIFMGFRMIVSPIKVPFLGMKCISCSQTAFELDKNNPIAVMQVGNMLYYRPRKFGGSKMAALNFYQKAEKLWESSGATTGEWNYLNLLALMGMAYRETGLLEKAKAYGDKVRLLEPRFKWLNAYSYPSLQL
jgi:hypothetical protein